VRIWLRVLLLVVALGVLGVAGVEVVRSRLEQGGALRTSLEAAVRGQLGVGLRPGSIEVSFVPAQIRLRDAALDLPGNVKLVLGDVRCALALGALLEGDARIQWLSISGPASLVHRQLRLDGELEVELRPGAAPHSWSLRAHAKLAEGGNVEASGGLLEGGAFEGTIDLEGVEVEPFAVYLASDRGRQPQLRGRYAGTFELPPAGGTLSTLRLASEAAEIHVAGASLVGPVALVAEIPVSLVSGDPDARFAIDATRARVEYAGVLVRGSARGASLGGRIVRDIDGRLRLEEVGLKVMRFEGEVRPEGGDAG
jgi:hypothetical protein